MDSRLAVKNIRTFMGTDFQGYNCTLYFDGVKVADVINDGGGGDTEYRYVGPNFGRDVEQQVLAYAKTLPNPDWSGTPDCPEFKDESGSARLDDAVAKLIDEVLNARELKRMVSAANRKGQTLLELPGDAEKGVYKVLKMPWGPAAKAWIEKKYPGVAVCVLNAGLQPKG